MAMKNAGQPIGPKVRLTTYDPFVQTNKRTNDNGYKRLEAALDRLAGTGIKTTATLPSMLLQLERCHRTHSGREVRSYGRQRPVTPSSSLPDRS